MPRYEKHFNAKVTDQNQAIPGSQQIQNNAGGFVFEVDDWTRLDRFLILGTEGGSYYATEREMTIKNCEAVLRCLQSDGIRVVSRVVEISEAGRAPKNDQAIFVLAIAAKKGNDVTRKAALKALPRVCRIGTHLFQFVAAMEQFGGWGRGTRRAVGNWYTGKSSEALAYQLVKYRQRNGWSHRDVLRLAKPAIGYSSALAWAVGKPTKNDLPHAIEGFIVMESAKTDSEVIRTLINYPELPWETVPSEHLKSLHVWEALLPNMKMTALIRNLARMSANGLLVPMSDAAKLVVQKITNAESLKKERVHPIAVLGALGAYKQGFGVKGSLRWVPVTAVVDALDEAFYLAFGNVEPSNKRTLIALDISGSMGFGNIAGMPGITPRIGSAAMAMVTARSEQDYAVVGFTSSTKGLYGGKWDGASTGLTPIEISPRQRLDDICKKVEALPMGGTDCALPMWYAAQHRINVDTFLLFTDNETWAGKIHPIQALDMYRQKTGIPAKLIVVGMTAEDFSIADPLDAGMLDIVGFDQAAPNLISNFSAGR